MSNTHDSIRPRPSRKHADLSVPIVPHFMGNSNECLVTRQCKFTVGNTGENTPYLYFSFFYAILNAI